MNVEARPADHRRAAAAEDWREYIRAAERKLSIARYHLDRLRQQPSKVPDPSIAEQAEFEGVLVAFVSATEQVAGAIHVAQGGSGNARPLRELLSHMSCSEAVKRLKKWDDTPIVGDIRGVRNRAAHRYYKKVGTGDAAQVEKPAGGSSYNGPRELVPYCSAAVGHLDRLAPLLADLVAELADRT